MEILQYIFTSTCSAAMTPKMAYDMSCMSVGICEKIGITGRVFANCQQALAMIEGPPMVVEQYYQAVNSDSVVETVFLHVNRVIPKREFLDYSAWLNLGTDFEFGDKVRKLTPETAISALPNNPSARLRIMTEAYLGDDMLIAV